MNLTKLIPEIKKNGGVTYNLNTGEMNPVRGYMVSTEDELVVPEITEEILKGYVSSHSSLADPNKYLGVWFVSHGSESAYVLDVSENFTEKRNAIFFGIIRNQKAIWDNKNRKAIKIKTHDT